MKGCEVGFAPLPLLGEAGNRYLVFMSGYALPPFWFGGDDLGGRL